MGVGFVPKDGWQNLEYDKVLLQLQKYCISEFSKERILEIPINTTTDLVLREFAKVREWQFSLDENEGIHLDAIEDISKDISLLRKEGYVLPIEAILRINVIVQNHRRLNNHFSESKSEKYPVLCGLFKDTPLDTEVYTYVDKIFTEEGEVKDSASQELMNIGKQIKSKQKAIDQAFNQMLSSYRKQGLLSDTSESYRNGRRVLSVPAENKRKIKGVIHDESATGRTVYIEPEAISSLNNDLFDLFAERKREIFRIVKELCNQLRPYAQEFINSFELQLEYDVIQAKCAFGRSFDGSIPKMVAKPNFAFKQAYHPLLLLKNKRDARKTVPFDLILHGQNRMLMISGPNAGGKSILMKAVGLLQLMFQASIPVPVDSDSTFGIFKKFFVDIGDQQSIEDDLSTYSSRLKNMKAFSEQLDRDSLVLIDEFGSGTDPKIGGAIAEALLRSFVKTKCFAVITSHYSNLKLYAYKTHGIVNGAMIFDKAELRATYEMKIGRPGSSFAFEIASKTGLDPKILEYAKSKTGKDTVQVEDLLTDLQREKKELEEKVSKLEQKSKDLERLIKNYELLHGELEYKRKKLSMEIKAQKLSEKNIENKQVEKLIREIKESQNLEKAKKLSKTIKKEQEALSGDYSSLKKAVYYAKDVDTSQFKKGDFIKMKTGSEIGKILKIKKDKAEISIGIMRMFVPLNELIPAKEPIEINSRRSVSTTFTSNHQDVDSKLDIRGFTKGEAEKIIEDFLDRLLLSNTHEAQIIHGVGTGVLKKAVWKKAAEYKDFTRVWHPEENQGGEGITFIQV